VIFAPLLCIQQLEGYAGRLLNALIRSPRTHSVTGASSSHQMDKSDLLLFIWRSCGRLLNALIPRQAFDAVKDKSKLAHSMTGASSSHQMDGSGDILFVEYLQQSSIYISML
jgi:hypothetical protein